MLLNLSVMMLSGSMESAIIFAICVLNGLGFVI
jgi:hypothetical protein